ncbi:hypothetical protein T12_4078 [Trichinella patagoniensis]|uniref:Uncharacterized protein n=1 Tax=Trichinella patagoniensis TaxID=990121 RepID=A0A0V1ADP8_9BILA|nr:hypothetical protein T12_4078 [Trichinella patagoniensis]
MCYQKPLRLRINSVYDEKEECVAQYTEYAGAVPLSVTVNSAKADLLITGNVVVAVAVHEQLQTQYRIKRAFLKPQFIPADGKRDTITLWGPKDLLRLIIDKIKADRFRLAGSD